jgi:hypothetical protein
MMQEKCGRHILSVPYTEPVLPIHCVAPSLSQSQAKIYTGHFMLFKVLGTLRMVLMKLV